MLWALCLYLLGFPLLLVSLAFVTVVGLEVGVDPGSPTTAGEALDAAFVGLALAPFAGAAVAGGVGWWRSRRGAPLVLGVLAVLTAVLLLRPPSV